ncbi:hypothetical protein OPT61_g6854 [Boeremia exigua]|uniref:Uncharacterized protein n=1 Tax=Boeremia exigua TaxID=749465 RepID=A0ACC2I5R4_9PLEO|nr:hypothetical protein OPT61_g6854 [Boeremia exigua]
MPYVRGSNQAAKATELCWDSWAAPTPEAASWQPDPDSIPVAADLPNSRLNRAPHTERQKQALKRQKLLGRPVGKCSENSGDLSPGNPTENTVRLAYPNNSPAPSSHDLGPTRVAAPPLADTRSTPLDAPKLLGLARMRQGVSPESTCKPSPVSNLTGSISTSIDDLSSRRPLDGPYTSAATIFTQVPGSLVQKSVPDWARPLAHMLREPPHKLSPSSCSILLQDQPAALPMKSTPPHLRKHKKSVITAVIQPESAVETAKEIYKELPVRQDMSIPLQCAVEAEVELNQNIKPTDTLFRGLTSENSPTLSQEHRRYLRTRLIAIMEDEMDMQRRTTRQEFSAMADEDFETHFDKTVSMHKLTWDLK